MIVGLGFTAGLGIKVSGCGMAEVSGTLAGQGCCLWWYSGRAGGVTV